MAIVIDLNKAKSIAHTIRREARSKEFAPYDEIIAKNIPGFLSLEAEEKRQQIRDKYALLQTQMDNAATVEQLKTLLPEV